jgi:hypothetical protein
VTDRWEELILVLYSSLSNIHSSSASDAFYGLFYLGLYNEARYSSSSNSSSCCSKAAGYLKQALQTPYALASNDYMVACARVHVVRRGWT